MVLDPKGESLLQKSPEALFKHPELVFEHLRFRDKTVPVIRTTQDVWQLFITYMQKTGLDPAFFGKYGSAWDRSDKPYDLQVVGLGTVETREWLSKTFDALVMARREQLAAHAEGLHPQLGQLAHTGKAQLPFTKDLLAKGALYHGYRTVLPLVGIFPHADLSQVRDLASKDFTLAGVHRGVQPVYVAVTKEGREILVPALFSLKPT